MEEYFLAWGPENKLVYILFSLIVNILIAISGVVPSAFLTAANITILDFKIGLIVSIIGEALGAIVSFILYRKGITKLSNHVKVKNKLLIKLQYTKGWEAIFLVFVLRILPFVPSGVVTLTAAFSKMGLIPFSMASTLGKVPSLLIEAYSVDSFLQLSSQWQLGIFIFVLLIIVIFFIFKLC